MKTASFALSSVCLAALGLALLGARATGQVIGLKSVPLAAGEQFLIFPTNNLAMASASIALDDLLLDPFSNPARGVRPTGSHFFSVPTSHTVSNENGGARTMPVGVQLTGDRWFGGLLVALQDLDQGRALARWLPPMTDGAPAVPRADALAVRFTTNRFAPAPNPQEGAHAIAHPAVDQHRAVRGKGPGGPR